MEVVQPSALESMQRAEIDLQISTAQRLPRSMETFKQRAVEMATLDEETAESCIYRRPVGKENGKPIYAEGMSVRCAEIVGACYGNLRVYTVTLETTERFCRVRGVAHDLQSNFMSSSEVVEATVRRDGSPYDERMRAVILKSAHAKARRDATFQVVPRALAKPIEAAVRKLLVGDAKSMEKRRTAVVGWIKALGIESNRVYAAVGVAGASDLTEDHLEKLSGLKTAIKDNDVAIDEAFPVISKKPEIPFPFAPTTGPVAAPVTAQPPQSDSKDADDGGLGPERTPPVAPGAEKAKAAEPETQPAADPQREQLAEDTDYKVVNATLRGLIKLGGVNEDQVLAHLKTEGVAKKSSDDLWALQNLKLVRLVNTWDEALPKIKAIQT